MKMLMLILFYRYYGLLRLRQADAWRFLDRCILICTYFGGGRRGNWDAWRTCDADVSHQGQPKPRGLHFRPRTLAFQPLLQDTGKPPGPRREPHLEAGKAFVHILHDAMMLLLLLSHHSLLPALSVGASCSGLGLGLGCIILFLYYYTLYILNDFSFAVTVKHHHQRPPLFLLLLLPFLLLLLFIILLLYLLLFYNNNNNKFFIIYIY